MNLGFSEMLFIFVVALLIFGPKKLPEIGRQIGKAMAEFKRATNDFKYQLENEMRQLELQEALKRQGDSLKSILEPPSQSIAGGGASLSRLEAAAAAMLNTSGNPEPDVPHPPDTAPANSNGNGEVHAATPPAADAPIASTEPVVQPPDSSAAVESELKSEAAKGPNA